MSALPKVLVIDDDFGRVLRRTERGAEILENPDREAFCKRAGLQDVTGDISAEQITEPVAEAVFISGVNVQNARFEQDLAGTLAAIRRGWEVAPRWAMILLDLHFKTGQVKPDGMPAGRAGDRDPHRYFGLTILEYLQKDESLRGIPVIILSAMERERIEERFARGASDFVDKSTLTRKKLECLRETFGLLGDDRIVGHSVPLLKCLREARVRAMLGNDNILVLGETGTGKELLADYIHKQSRRPGDMVPLFTVGVPETLIDDRLFGHRRGAHDGAHVDMVGAAELANRGTLFIDEFGCIPASIQAKLLRLLDKNTREVQRLGDTRTTKLDLQIILATNEFEILESAKEEDWRSDLLFRVNKADPIVLPPLRERKEDIPLLVDHFLRKFEAQFVAEPRKVNGEALQRMIEHDWPDNVRGLERVIERAVYRWKGLRALVPEHLKLGSSKPRQAPVDESTNLKARQNKPEAAKHVTQTVSMDGVLNTLREFSPDLSDLDAWKGRLDELQYAYAILLSKLLKAALMAGRDFKGQIQHTPAMRLLAGRKIAEKGEASIAYSVIKNLLNHHPPALEEILSDSVLKEIFERACEKRSGKKAKNQAPAGDATLGGEPDKTS